MNIFNSMAGLLKFLLTEKFPGEIESVAVKSMHCVEECTKCGLPAYLVICKSAKESSNAKEKFRLNTLTPEIAEEIICCENEIWQKRVYIFSDAGDGVILLEKRPKSHE